MASRMRWSVPLSSARWALAGELADIEQRQRAAGDLLRAAIRIAVERRQQARRIERRRGADRNRHAAGAGHEIGEHVARQRQALALGERLDRAPRQDLRRRPHRQRVSCARAQSRPGPLTSTLTVPLPAALAVIGTVDGAALLGAQRRASASRRRRRRRHRRSSPRSHSRRPGLRHCRDRDARWSGRRAAGSAAASRSARPDRAR